MTTKDLGKGLTHSDKIASLTQDERKMVKIRLTTQR